MKRSKKKLPKQLLTIDDVKLLADNTKNLRDRALILLLYEAGCHVGELVNIKIKDIEFDTYGVKVNLFGKTEARKIRVIASAPAISNWLLERPNRNLTNYDDSFLICSIWAKNRGKELLYEPVNKLLRDAGGRAGITKPLNPYHFCHSRATEFAKKLTEDQFCQNI
jgi:site-specific recombinase XerD